MRPAATALKYDGITAAGLDAYEERIAIYNRDGGRCRTCGESVAFDAFELAHRIANTVANRKRWGSTIIDHPLNRVVAHPGRCNSAQNIGGSPGACAELIKQIQEGL